MGLIESVRGAEMFAPEETGGLSLEDVFTAYMDCRRKKRGTYNALAFEVDWERRCADLLGRINAGEYRPLRSLVFIIRKPVMREVFAPAFESRVVDHLIARKIEPLLEERFIDDSYSTRKGKGTLFGIERMERHIRACSHDYTRDCYVMKLDIRSFFMDLPKPEFLEPKAAVLRERYDAPHQPPIRIVRSSIACGGVRLWHGTNCRPARVSLTAMQSTDWPSGVSRRSWELCSISIRSIIWSPKHGAYPITAVTWTTWYSCMKAANT